MPVSVTGSALRAQIATLQPSSASVSATTLPIPRVPPFTIARLPFN
jgi:hypothetical protein